MHIKYRDNEFSLYSRDDKVLDALKVFSDGMCSAIQGSLNQRMIQEPANVDDQQSSYWSYTKSYLEYPVKGVTNFVGRKLFSLD